jgi:hypothetical protein
MYFLHSANAEELAKSASFASPLRSHPRHRGHQRDRAGWPDK